MQSLFSKALIFLSLVLNLLVNKEWLTPGRKAECDIQDPAAYLTFLCLALPSPSVAYPGREDRILTG